ncbi:carboxylate-amine ligase [Cryptosporangium aurantiacum]|uniref:Putative glutamate--cysteine ligase 2 n=1 Tax=Cryptosporangium aurantiacum TaxID=134849 RepID=A0A1M7N3Y9_9ACTN|nr:glutamate--cysteine ligase [Cryptosporangium aurantiacum]SHM98282.1 carboxylate-amine ligase [Cryptosporangium aurantiacum]
MNTAPTLGVEEEFLLLDPATGENVPLVEPLLATLPDDLRDRTRLEFRRCMLELVTAPAVDLTDVAEQLHRLRSAAASAATGVGARVVPVGATPVSDTDRRTTTNPRFAAIAGHYGPIARDPAVCGCHVHVGVPSRAAAIDVCRRIRPWLPVVQALAVNSPLHAGADTGYASWRSVQLDRWPSLGPIPHFESADEYDRTVGALVASGVMLDATMVLWHCRPSTTYPTVEVRVADVCPTVGDTVLVAGLVRGLVATALAGSLDSGRVPDHLLRAAHWNAAHTGLAGTLLDPRVGRARPAWTLVDELLETLGPALRRNGDADVVTLELERLQHVGTGAERQRRTFARTGSISAVLAELSLEE